MGDQPRAATTTLIAVLLVSSTAFSHADQGSTPTATRNRPGAMQASVSDLEEFPYRYIGKTITVTADVEEVFGPRLFKIDESNWADIHGEVLVYAPAGVVAIVRSTDTVTIRGTMRMFLKADLDRELAWLGPRPGPGLPFSRRPVLVAGEIVSRDSDTLRFMQVSASDVGNMVAPARGGTGTADRLITDASVLAQGDCSEVGRYVRIESAKVGRLVSTSQGLWVDTAGGSFFLLPVPQEPPRTLGLTPGQTVSVAGLVLEMPRPLRDHAPKGANHAIYVYGVLIP